MGVVWRGRAGYPSLPSSCFFCNERRPWYKKLSTMPATVKTPPTMAQTPVRKWKKERLGRGGGGRRVRLGTRQRPSTPKNPRAQGRRLLRAPPTSSSSPALRELDDNGRNLKHDKDAGQACLSLVGVDFLLVHRHGVLVGRDLNKPVGHACERRDRCLLLVGASFSAVGLPLADRHAGSGWEQP